jgi:hypothetical protein
MFLLTRANARDKATGVREARELNVGSTCEGQVSIAESCLLSELIAYMQVD